MDFFFDNLVEVSSIKITLIYLYWGRRGIQKQIYYLRPFPTQNIIVLLFSRFTEGKYPTVPAQSQNFENPVQDPNYSLSTTMRTMGSLTLTGNQNQQICRYKPTTIRV